MLRRLFSLRSTFPIDQPFTQELGQHRLQYEPSGATLVVSFDNAARPAQEEYKGRPTWGESFYRAEGHSLLGVIARKASWYRDASLIGALEELRNNGFFASFEKVVMTGGSMGGFAAAAFAPLAKNTVVLAFSPQNTLNSSYVPWEERYPHGQAQDWSLPYSNAADGLAQAREAFVFYDPLIRPDKRHAVMMAAASATNLLSVPAGGHGVPPMLIQTKLLKPVSSEIIAGTFNVRSFTKSIRARKETIRYFRMLAREALLRNRPRLCLRVCDAGLRKFPQSDLQETRALALSALGRPALALQGMDEARNRLLRAKP